MNFKLMLAAIACAIPLMTTTVAWSGANDYTFEPVKAEIKKGDGITIAVRIIDKRSGNAVSDAVIFSPRVDMSPEGMETMTAVVTPTAGPEPGTYGFKTNLPMAGRWLLTVPAKVQGELQTVTGKVTFKATD